MNRQAEAVAGAQPAAGAVVALCRGGAAWQLLPACHPLRQAIGNRLGRWVRLGLLERALAMLKG